jgi:O-antigen ligase
LPSYYSILIVLALAWGTFAFGAVYDWAYVPLAWACAGIGALGLIAPGARPRKPMPLAVAAGLALVALAALLQLAPLGAGTLRAISPATDRFLQSYDVAYALAGRGGDAAAAYRHGLSVNSEATWLGLACLGAFGLLLLGTARALGRYSLRPLAAGIVILGFALALEGIVQSGLYIRDPSPTMKVYGLWEPINKGTHPFGVFINRNHFAGAMLLALPMAIGYFCALVARGMRGVKPTFRDRVLWFSSPDASRVVLTGLAVAVMGLSLVLTLSRSGIAGFLLALAISTWFAMRRQGGRSKRMVAGAYLVLVVGLCLGWAGLDAILARFSKASSDFFSTRFIAWGDAWTIVKDFPWFGTGLNTYGYATLFYETPGLPRHYVEAHNDYLQLLAEGGVLLAIPIVIALVLLGREIRRRFGENTDDTTTYWLRLGATTGLVAIALQEIVEFSLQIPGIAALFAVAAAIAIHRPDPRRAERGEQAPEPEPGGEEAQEASRHQAPLPFRGRQSQ